MTNLVISDCTGLLLIHPTIKKNIIFFNKCPLEIISFWVLVNIASWFRLNNWQQVWFLMILIVYLFVCNIPMVMYSDKNSFEVCNLYKHRTWISPGLFYLYTRNSEWFLIHTSMFIDVCQTITRVSNIPWICNYFTDLSSFERTNDRYNSLGSTIFESFILCF